MKVYRFPVTRPDEYKLIGEKSLKESLKNDSIDFNISLNKKAERQSAISIDFDMQDYEHLQTQILSFFKRKLNSKDEEIADLKKKVENLNKMFSILRATIMKTPDENISKEWLDTLTHLLERTAYENSDLVAKNITDETSLKETMSILVRINNSPWTME